MTTPFQVFNEKLQRFQHVDKLYAALAQHAYDGTEVHHVVDHELRGLEHGVTAPNIKTAIEAKYHDTIPIDAVIEIVGKLVELMWDRPFPHSGSNSH
jgi:hypothetical protein